LKSIPKEFDVHYTFESPYQCLIDDDDDDESSDDDIISLSYSSDSNDDSHISIEY
jgi:hypothetical protein